MGTYTNLKAEQFLNTFNNTDNAQIIDVRTEREFKEKHIEGAVNIPGTEKARLLNLDKNKIYFLHCRVGGRSAMAAHTMATNGYTVYNLNDNIEEVLRTTEAKAI